MRNIHLLISKEWNSIQMHPCKAHACTVLCRVGEVMGSRIIWIHLEWSTTVYISTCLWCVQGWNQRSSRKGRIPGADLEGLCSGRGGGGPEHPLPLNYQNIHLREQHFKIFGVIRGNFVCLFQNFPAPFAHLLSHLTRMKVPFNDFADCLGNFKVVHRSYTFFTCAEQLHFFL